jgi:Fur family peroxide stress response transcriptional regulator
MIALDGLRQQLKKSGLRVTPQRMAIMQTLRQSKEHPTAEMIHQKIREQYPNIALGTVYYTLEKLVESGIVTALGPVGDDHVHYDGDMTVHSHLAGLSCHKIIDVPAPDLEGLTIEIETRIGFKVLGSNFVYYGICPDCQRLINQIEPK